MPRSYSIVDARQSPSDPFDVASRPALDKSVALERDAGLAVAG
jgi:hypothetical protein